MPSNFPPWQTVYHVFRKWTLDHTWTAVDETLRTCVRLHEGRDAEPTAAVLDSQSVKSDGHGGEVGYDAAKCIKGRNRHILVDMLGLLLGVAVTPANCPEREGGKAVLEKLAGWLGRLRKIWVDGGYSGESFDQWVRQFHPKAEVEVVNRSEAKGFKLLPKRWVVERTFAWLMRQRRLVRDYERTESSAEAWIHLAMIRIQLNRLA
jgi:putative transposase